MSANQPIREGDIVVTANGARYRVIHTYKSGLVHAADVETHHETHFLDDDLTVVERAGSTP